MAANDKMIAFRGPGDVYDRAERLQTALARKGKPMTVSSVLRLALEEGLKAMERKHRSR